MTRHSAYLFMVAFLAGGVLIPITWMTKTLAVPFAVAAVEFYLAFICGSFLLPEDVLSGLA